MRAKLFVAALTLGLLLSVLVAIPPPAQAAVTASVDPPKYDPFFYTPGETIRFTINVGPADPRTFDVLVVWDNGPSRIEWSGTLFDDQTIPAAVSSLVLTYTMPAAIPDGDYYWIEVHDENWIENAGVGTSFGNIPRLFVRTWAISLEFDRPAYLPGDDVTVIWSVNSLRNGSLAPNGSGKLWVWDSADIPLISPNPHTFLLPTGTLQFTLLGTVPTDRSIIGFAYYNNTQSNPDRFASANAFAEVDGLRIVVNVPSNTYEPGGIVTLDVRARVTDGPIFPTTPGAPGVEIDITVTDQLTGLAVDGYGAQNLLTDAHGYVRHGFQLASGVAEGTSYQVLADGVANNAVTASGTDVFAVAVNVEVVAILTFNKNQYMSGDLVEMDVDVLGSAGPFTYMYEVRDGTTGSLLAGATSTDRRFSYRIPNTYDGPIVFQATADDGGGNPAVAGRQFTVLTGLLLVNLDRMEYGANDRITASFSLLTNVMTAPTFYYEVFDTSAFPFTLVESGVVTTTTATAGSVTFQVPAVPADEYTFLITATELGRVVMGDAFAVLTGGVLLQITVDKTSYLPGETIRISYALIPRGRTALPQAFAFVIEMFGTPRMVVQTASDRGELTFALPADIGHGPTNLFVYELTTGASANTVVRIGSTNPLWDTTIGGIPAFAVILGIALLFVILLMVLMWRRMSMGGIAPKAPAEKPAPPPSATAVPGPAPMSVSCKACGSPIEITTSKRPIEVMCPNCGETQMAQ